MTVNDEGEKIWKEEVLAFDKTDYHHSAGGDNLKQQKAPVETVNFLKQIHIWHVQNIESQSLN
jgi:hypothetical protein